MTDPTAPPPADDNAPTTRFTPPSEPEAPYTAPTQSFSTPSDPFANPAAPTENFSAPMAEPTPMAAPTPVPSWTPLAPPQAGNPYQALPPMPPPPPVSGVPASGAPLPPAPPPYGYAPYGGYAAPVPGYGQGYGQPMVRRTNGMAIAAMVVSICAVPSLCLYGVPGLILGPLGAILGHIARKRIRQSGEEGAGMALAGIITGWIATGLAILIIAFYAFVFIAIFNDPEFQRELDSGNDFLMAHIG